jgi:hypothetical protein
MLKSEPSHMTSDGCKVEFVADRYDLDRHESRYESIDDRLLARWTGADDAEAVGYRTLADWFNKRLLRASYDEHGREVTGARVESDHEALTGDDDLLRQEVLDDLADARIDGDRLLDDMISWSTLRTHLTACLDGEKPTPEAETDWEQDSVDVARDIALSNVSEAVSALAAKGTLPGGDEADVQVQVLLSCPSCPTRIPFEDAVERGYVCREHLGSATGNNGGGAA